jgi:hypothetical protein
MRFERLVARHVHTRQGRCPSLKRKRISPYVLRRMAAMDLLGHPHCALARSRNQWKPRRCISTPTCDAKSRRTHHADRRETRPVPPTRSTPRVSRAPGIMPTDVFGSARSPPRSRSWPRAIGIIRLSAHVLFAPGDAWSAGKSDSGTGWTPGPTQRYMHLSPAALDAAIRPLETGTETSRVAVEK